VSELTDRFPAEKVTWLDGAEIELSRETLPAETHIFVLKSSLTELS
jgi:hypothetical protein